MSKSSVVPLEPRAFNSDWVEGGVDENCLKFLEGFGLYLVDKTSTNPTERPGRNAMTTSQLRNIFSEAKQIESKVRIAQAFKNSDEKKAEEMWNKEIKPRILLLRPKIAYAAARAIDRDRYSKMQAFREVADKALIEAAKSMDNYTNFINILEAIIAYHKMYGGRDR